MDFCEVASFFGLKRNVLSVVAGRLGNNEPKTRMTTEPNVGDALAGLEDKAEEESELPPNRCKTVAHS